MEFKRLLIELIIWMPYIVPEELQLNYNSQDAGFQLLL